MKRDELAALGWPQSRLGDAMAALLRKAKLSSNTRELINPPDSSSSAIGSWIEWAAKRFSCEAEPIETTVSELNADLPSAYPALLQLEHAVFLAIFSANGRYLRILTPELQPRRVRTADVCRAIREPAEREQRAELGRLLDGIQLPRSKRDSTLDLLLSEQGANRPFHGCWVLRLQPGMSGFRLLRQAGAVGNGSGILLAHTVQYLLWLASWTILGRLSFKGHMDPGWLIAWALLLLTLIPFRVLTTWLQGRFAIGVGRHLKRRLLCGAMRLRPEEMRHCGIGSFLAQALEAEALESLALSGGIAGVLAIIEITAAAFVLGRFCVFLLFWCLLTAALGWNFLYRYKRWTETRMELTQDLVEAMVGHRTRLAQQHRERWHEPEDQALDNYVQISRSVDRSGEWLIGAVPRGWLLLGLTCLAPAIIAGRNSATETAIRLGGILLAFTAFRRLTGSFAEVAAAWVAWARVSPLFHAARRPEMLGGALPERQATRPGRKLIEAHRLSFRYRSEGNPVLEDCSLVIRKNERILLEGASGSGKTTFASLLCGTREPSSGLLLIGGIDRQTAGSERWREQIAAAPQFHENHILTETLAFNLLMGRRWPPTRADLEEAEAVCRELGLGELLDRMPGGLFQMVGEGGWQLSHGERSRVYIARALLQNAEIVVLDESFAALDPENLRTALECTLSRAPTLMVIAHP